MIDSLLDLVLLITIPYLSTDGLAVASVAVMCDHDGILADKNIVGMKKYLDRHKKLRCIFPVTNIYLNQLIKEKGLQDMYKDRPENDSYSNSLL